MYGKTSAIETGLGRQKDREYSGRKERPRQNE